MARSGRHGDRRRILVLANETSASQAVRDEVVASAGSEDPEVLVVAPALSTSRLAHWLSTNQEVAREAAEERLAASLEGLRGAGVDARGQLGEGDPLQALDDAVRVFQPHAILIATHTPERSTWLERRVVEQARERYAQPVSHVVVDLEHEQAVVDPGRRPGAGAPTAPLRLFHASDYEAALEIKAGGFPAGPGAPAVRLTEAPEEPQDQPGAPVLFWVEIPPEAVSAYRSAGSDGRVEYLVPAALVNRHGPPVAASEDAIE